MQIKKIAVSAAIVAALSLAGVGKREEDEKECLHRRCSGCNGTGRKENGETCVHYISCPCPIHSARM